MGDEQAVLEVAKRARVASHALALATRADKDRALHAMADALLAREAEVLAANAENFGFYNLPSEPWHWSTTGS